MLTFSEWMFVVASIAWNQAMPMRLLTIYAVCVIVTAIGKGIYLWLSTN